MSASSKVTSAGLAGYRVGAHVIARWVALLAVIACALQVAFAAYGFWIAATSGGDEALTRNAFWSHTLTGQILQYSAAALFVLGLIAWTGWKGWVIPLVLAVLLFVVQGLLVGLGFGVNPWFGALHAFDGMIITAGFVWLMVNRWRDPRKAS
ncbi:MAG: hypothetical protein KF867_08195 [Cryobacterium sp.]|nr:hypothetical protein [Cryobacterium sp.]MBX3104943.1 hypothetical protein [Cryobacterium sp.]